MQLRGTSQYTLKKAHDRYGSVVRIAPNTLSFIEPSAWNDIYGSRNGGAALPKDPIFCNEMLMDKESVFTSSHDAARPIRKAMSPAFSHKALLELEPMLRSHTDCLIAQLIKTSQREGSVDMSTWSRLSMFDISSDFVFGDALGCVRDGIYHEWAQVIVDFSYGATLLHQCHKFWPLHKVLALLIPPSVRDRTKRHNEASLERIRRRIHSPTDRPDFMFYFLRQAEKEQLSKKVIEAQASVLIAAASESTATALTAAIYYITSNDDVYRRLCEEVRSAFKTSADISLQGLLPRLPYLEACVQETLRIHTPFANGFTRLVANSEGTKISGNWVPQNVRA